MPVTVEKVPYEGFRNCVRLSNGRVELVFVGDVGPRIIRYGFVGGPNFFKEMSPAEEDRLTGGQDWNVYGGHRIWVAPEARVYTYASDDAPVSLHEGPDCVRGVAPADRVGIEKEIEVRMSESGEVRVEHRLTNRSDRGWEFAPWAVTMMAPGGSAVATFPPRGTHPEHLAPSNPLVMWRFTDLSDPCWLLLEKYLVLHNDPGVAEPEKAGLFNPFTCGAYLLGSQLFVKRYQAPLEGTYPDMGASFEAFTNDMFLELETLGPIERVEPGGAVEHVETWSLHDGVELNGWSEAEVDRAIGPLLA